MVTATSCHAALCCVSVGKLSLVLGFVNFPARLRLGARRFGVSTSYEASFGACEDPRLEHYA